MGITVRLLPIFVLISTAMAQPPMPPRLVVTPINKHPLWRFNVYYGPASRSYTNITNVEFPYLGSNTFRIGIAPIPIQTNFYGVTVVDKQYGMETDWPPEISAKTILPAITLTWKWYAPKGPPAGPTVVTISGGTNSLSITNPIGSQYYRLRSVSSTKAQLLASASLGKMQIWNQVAVWTYAPSALPPEPSIAVR